MANTFTKVFFTNGTNGRGIGINQSTPPGQTIHYAPPGASAIDEIWLFATNNGSTALPVTVCWGGTNASDIQTTNVSPSVGPTLLVDGVPLNNSNQVSVYVNGIYSTAVMVTGFVNRIT